MKTEEKKDMVFDSNLSPDVFDELVAMGEKSSAEQAEQAMMEKLSAFEVEKLSNEKYIITGTKSKKELCVDIPDCILCIGAEAFRGSDIISVTLPEGLMKIEHHAFADCTDLEIINFPSSLRIIEDEAFAGCKSLDIEPPANIRIGKNAFKDTLPFIREAEAAAEREAERKRKEEAEKAEEERRRKEAEAKAAEKRRQKEEAERAEAERKRKEMEKKAAEEEAIRRAESQRKAKDAFDREFEIKNGVLNKYSGNSWRVDFLDFYRYKYYVQPIVKIGYEAFLNNSQLKEIFFVFGETIDVIGQSAFENCKELIKIGHLSFGGSTLYVPRLSVKKIGRYAFRNCKKLNTIHFDDNLEEIEPYAFEGCTGLTTVGMSGKWTLISSEKLKPSKKIDLGKGTDAADLIRKYQSYHWFRKD